ncbi:MAG: hypothetical protein GX275_12170 [Clostridiales bacterium]|nr:hypothetical protein [Clostridiales bacterium]
MVPKLSTIDTWRAKALAIRIKGENTSDKVMSLSNKFLIVMETYTMPQSYIGKYCREKEINNLFYLKGGIYYA